MGTAFYALGHFVNLPDRKSSAMWNSYHPSMILLFALFVVVVEAHQTDVTPIGAIFAVLAIVVAVALNLFGYRLGKLTVLIIVTIFSAVIAFWVIAVFHIDSEFPLSEIVSPGNSIDPKMSSIMLLPVATVSTPSLSE